MQPCIGLIGGLAVGASCQYYKRLVEAMHAGGSPLHLVLVHADLDKVVAHMAGQQSKALAEYFTGLIAQMQAAGATEAVVTSVASHYGFAELTRRSPLPLVSILQAIREEVEAQKLTRVALFGSRFVVESNLYGALAGVTEVVRPYDEEIASIDRIYMGLAHRGSANLSDEQEITAFAETIRKREGLDAIVLAGTDYSVLYDDHRAAFPHLDCTDLHIRAIARRLTQ